MIDNLDIIIYKTNYKDFEYGIRLFKNLLIKQRKKFYLIGPFACINCQRIKEKYDFIDEIINIENEQVIHDCFPQTGEKVTKNTIVCGVDREVEYQEKGRYINLEASTGCIYNCAFCHIKLLNYSKNEKDLNILMDEIDYLINVMGKRYFIFNDSIFWKNNSDNDRIKSFIKMVKERNLKFYFMIYLSLSIKISDDLLKELQEIGLIRVFFGVENISSSFSKNNNKYISAIDTENFIKLLKSINVSYHIGFILFNPFSTYDEIKENIDFLFKIKKLFRIGVIVEKMRILPTSKDASILQYDDSKIDQAYNYYIKDDMVEKYYKLLNQLFLNINIRNFEQFISGINIAITILKNENKLDKYKEVVENYKNTLNRLNERIYSILMAVYEQLKYSDSEISELKDLYSEAEVNYINFMKALSTHDREIYEMIPHGQEELNIW